MEGYRQETFVNQKQIEYKVRALAATITRSIKQTDQWLTASHAINTAIIKEEIGDFEDWMKTMEFDCKSNNVAIRNIHQD
ncbi:hypothetical protein Tsubulata_034501 [Turnera subulata]|uniref:Biogenesis of lysosome-related organelles complex 1 subunit 1 n=1 Tax=Turnera subulata TaxID=218843 RepID=A0A9Q0GG73_9ROSI|nr:hypothetical protein Tsubulata_034501 [Turnera subulata]